MARYKHSNSHSTSRVKQRIDMPLEWTINACSWSQGPILWWKTYGDEIVSRRKAEIFTVQIAVTSALWRGKQGDFYKFRVTFQFLMVWYTNSSPFCWKIIDGRGDHICWWYIDTVNETGDNNDAENEIVDDTYTKT